MGRRTLAAYSTSALVVLSSAGLHLTAAAVFGAGFGGTCAQEPAGTGGYVVHEDKDKSIPVVGRPRCVFKQDFVCEECVRERAGEHPDKPWRYCVEWPDPTAPPDT
ncbi:MAG: hypothetical protein ACREA0_15835, partial [bacterium]